MNWTTEVPKESGWYWSKVDENVGVVYLCPDLKTVWLIADDQPYEVGDWFFWGDKLEVPE